MDISLFKKKKMFRDIWKHFWPFPVMISCVIFMYTYTTRYASLHTPYVNHEHLQEGKSTL